MRAISALVTTAVVVAGLTACTQVGSAGGCQPEYKSGDASAYISVQGRFGAPQNATFPTPIVTKKTERTVLKQGDGAVLQTGDVAIFRYMVVNGTTGEVAYKSDATGAGSIITVGDSGTPSVTLGLRCATVGSRIAIATTPEGAGQTGGSSTDTFVFVIDILKSMHGKAEGWIQSPQPGMPAVVTAPDGAPGITIPNQDPPAGLAVNVLIGGTGKKVESDEYIVVKYTAVLWSDGSVFDSNWSTNNASIIQLKKSAKVPEGLVKALVGQRIGSQVLAVIPSDLAFGKDGKEGVPSNSTVVYVVDILGIAR